MPKEFALAPDGCKVMRCECGAVFVQHLKVYGCPKGTVRQPSSTGARCTCK